MPLMRKVLALVLLPVVALSAVAQYPGSAPVPTKLKKGFDSITQEDARKWLGTLSSKEFEGRGTGQPGFQKAANFMAARFKEFGLKPIGDKGTYFQNVPFMRIRSVPETSWIDVGGTKVAKGLAFRGIEEDAHAEAKAVFIKAASADAKLESEDAIKGKIVIVNVKQVGNSLRRQLFLGEPLAVLIIGEPSPGEGWSVRYLSGNQAEARKNGVLRATVSRADASALAEKLGIGRGFALEAAAGSALEIKESEASASLHASVQKENFGVPNVVGLLEGSDPALKSEVVGLGAHLDHLGINNGVIYPGADDDGSGSTALLEIARAMSLNQAKPKRSVLFMAFCGEEMGLIGSGYYANHPIMPNDHMICELQMDMVGRNQETQTEKPENNTDTMNLVGSKRISTELHQHILDVNKYVNFRFMYGEEGVYTRSDHYNFAAKGIPIAFVFSGFHKDYHQPTDTIEKINFEKLTNTAKLYYLAAWLAADRAENFKHDVSK